MSAAGLMGDFLQRRGEGLQVHQGLSSGLGLVLSSDVTLRMSLPLFGPQYPNL